MRKSVLLFILLLFAVSLSAQSLSTKVFGINIPQGFVLESISSKGFQSSGINHPANMNSMNPAALYAFESLSAGFSYQWDYYKMPNWYANIEHRRIHNVYPQSVGLVMPFNNVRLGLGFSQRYNSEVDYGMIIGTMVDPDVPDGYIETGVINPIKNVRVFSYAGNLSYAIKPFASRKNTISVGFQGNYNTLYINHTMYSDDKTIYQKTENSTDNIGWKAGILYDRAGRIQIGLFYEKNSFFDDEYIIDELVGEIHEKVPDKMIFGLTCSLNQNISLSTEIAKVYRSNKEDLYFLSDSYDISFGISGDVGERITCSLGFLSMPYLHENIQDTDLRLYGQYLLGGINLRFDHFDVDCTIVTNTMQAGEWRKQITGKMILGYYL
jgi:hypothetical protein